MNTTPSLLSAALDVKPDTRAFTRVDLSVEVSLDSEHNFFAGLSENISEGGVFVATHKLRPIGDSVTIELALPGAERPLRAACEVRWVRLYNEESDAPPGLGLMFVDLSDEDAASIRAFVEHRAPLFWM